MQKTKFSKHALNDREDRIIWIATEVGFGEIIDTLIIGDEQRGRRRACLTSTGVVIIKAEDKELVITMFCPTVNQVVGWYGNKNIVPIRLLNVCKQNEKRGWANWTGN